jgi:hypothetical protein
VYDDRTPVEATVHYSAPKMFEKAGKCTTNSDIFMFGFVLYEILHQKPVFNSKMESAFDVIRRLRARHLLVLPVGWGELTNELIPKCWQSVRGERPSFAAIFRLFQNCSFAIVPGHNPIVIHDYCQAVMLWEEGNPATA